MSGCCRYDYKSGLGLGGDGGAQLREAICSSRKEECNVGLYLSRVLKVYGRLKIAGTSCTLLSSPQVYYIVTGPQIAKFGNVHSSSLAVAHGKEVASTCTYHVYPSPQ